ncbi:hypothetical protein [Yinghuangia sp. YIM S10712]|uniref:hypothetical protein n=1 Tax=Yinghuangia sp. YIM S10712 TaxID=3436930 RepID=UPI003F52E8CD
MKNDKMSRALAWLALLAAVVLTAAGEYALFVGCGFGRWVSAAGPVCLDAYAVAAIRARREVLPAVLLMVGSNATAHLLPAEGPPVGVVVAVASLAPLVLWRTHSLLDREGVHDGGHPYLESVVDDDQVSRTTHLGVAAAAGDHLRGAAEMVAVEDAVSSWDEPWRAPWAAGDIVTGTWDDHRPGPLADHTQPQEIAAPYGTRAVAPVVAGWQSTTPSDDHRHDHLGDRQATSGVATEVVAPVVTSRPSGDRSHGHLDDHADDQPGTSCDPGKVVAPVVAEPVRDDHLDDQAGHQGDTAAWTLDDQAHAGTVTDADATLVRATTDDEGYGPVRTPAPEGTHNVRTLETGKVAAFRANRVVEPTLFVDAESPTGSPAPGNDAVAELSDADLRKAAGRLNREAVRDTRRPVTVETLQNELGLSRRRAAALRREVVGGAR